MWPTPWSWGESCPHVTDTEQPPGLRVASPCDRSGRCKVAVAAAGCARRVRHGTSAPVLVGPDRGGF